MKLKIKHKQAGMDILLQIIFVQYLVLLNMLFISLHVFVTLQYN